MKGQGGRRDAQVLADLAGGQPCRSGLDQQTEDRQAVFLSQGTKGSDRICYFHGSIIMEPWVASKRLSPA